MTYDREDFYEFWDGLDNDGFSERNVEAILDKNNKKEFEDRFDMYLWVIVCQRGKYEFLTFEELRDDGSVDVDSERKQELELHKDVEADVDDYF